MAAGIPFVREIDFEYGVVQQVSPLIRRVIANNPGPFTYTGTGTYIVGHGLVAVIDPGPDLKGHMDALERALEGEKVSHILVTHNHADHSKATGPLQERTGGRVCAFGAHRSEGLQEIALEEGVDGDFKPDMTLFHGAVVRGDDWTLECLHTPGHIANHMCFALKEERALFTGDHVMGWATSVVIPPDGAMSDYMSSLYLLQERSDKVLWPTHGPPVTEPEPFLEAYVAHRRMREAQIKACLLEGGGRIKDMVPILYADVNPRLHPAAQLSVYAHLLQMVEEGAAFCDGPPAMDSQFRLA